MPVGTKNFRGCVYERQSNDYIFQRQQREQMQEQRSNRSGSRSSGSSCRTSRKKKLQYPHQHPHPHQRGQSTRGSSASFYLGKQVNILVYGEPVNSDKGPLNRRRRSGSGGEDQPPATVDEGARGSVRNASKLLEGLHRLVH